MEQNSRAVKEISPGLLGRKPVIGLVLFLVGISIFTILAFSVVTEGPLLAWDKPIVNDLYERAMRDPSISVEAMRFSGDLGTYHATMITILLAIYWLWKQRRYEASMLLIGIISGAGWFYTLSRIFGRERPVFPTQLDPIGVPGFPSGHSMTAVLLYGLLLYLVFPHLTSWIWRIVAILDALLLILLVGFSRLYLGSHYPTDVLAGYAFGLAWGAMVYTIIELYYRDRSKQRKAH